MESRQLSQSSAGRDFCNLERYQSRQPSVYNAFFGINLITAVDRLPPLSKPLRETTEANLQQNRTEARGVAEHLDAEIENKVYAYHHEIDRLNQDLQINQYSITGTLLGRGAHSTVRLARSKDGFFAIKILWLEKIRKKYFIKQRQLVEMINAETNLLLRLRHPHIIQFKDAIYSPEKQRMFIVLEYCSRGSLQGVLNSRLTLEDELWHQEVHYYFQQMVEALLFMHQNGVIHRDVKPENMLLDQHGQLKLIDFNISQELKGDRVRVTNKFVGTKGYAAPELILALDREKMVLGKALDVWALGISLLELLERRHPFSVKTIEELHKYLSQDIPLSPDYPPELAQLLRGMLNRDNEQRITMEEVARSQWTRKANPLTQQRPKSDSSQKEIQQHAPRERPQPLREKARRSASRQEEP